MNIFFTGSIRGGRAHQPDYALIVKALEAYGTVSSRHVSDESLSEYGETNRTAGEVLYRERAAIEKCDVVVAEVTTPSHGVGYLISYASTLGKRIIALHSGENTLKLSALIKGDSNVMVRTYDKPENLAMIFAEILKK